MIEECDAYLEYIESDAIKQLIEKIYAPNSKKSIDNQQIPTHSSTYKDMIQKIDELPKKTDERSSCNPL